MTALITSGMVKKLREDTGLPMMDCKQALVNSNGDFENAVELLRKSSGEKLELREKKELKEGNIAFSQSHLYTQGGAMVLLGCETDFSAKSNHFTVAAIKIANHYLLHDSVFNQVSMDIITDLSAMIGEKVAIVDCCKFDDSLELSGKYPSANRFIVNSYIHHNEKTGAMAEMSYYFDGWKDGEVHSRMVEVVADVCMHITASPEEALYPQREDVSPELVAEMQDKYAEEAKGKPDKVIDKIVNGKMDKWYSQIVLTEQKYIKDTDITVGDYMLKSFHSDGCMFNIHKFTKMKV